MTLANSEDSGKYAACKIPGTNLSFARYFRSSRLFRPKFFLSRPPCIFCSTSPCLGSSSSRDVHLCRLQTFFSPFSPVGRILFCSPFFARTPIFQFPSGERKPSLPLNRESGHVSKLRGKSLFLPRPAVGKGLRILLLLSNKVPLWMSPSLELRST